ncbi:NifU-like protein [Rosistilla carotiformis]|uniref:NifU-like protein n=1 Tax=Rosistilla carotiformis TaxID=2528017 RepID=A0A518JXH1_9BACT|nr:iron-sulfur cluster assembly scaffold protein [Rosistilla carotiformis]QDV70247.1 NifU-like protein [Rosistilla carotiformis]
MSNSYGAIDQTLIDHFEDPYHRGDCEAATHVAEGENSLCGDTMQVQLRISPSDGQIEEAWFDGDGCVVSQAAASMLMETIEGMTPDAIRDFDTRAMLEQVGPSIAVSQQKCALLAWRVLQLALQSPLDEFGDGPTFGGPHLGEEN